MATSHGIKLGFNSFASHVARQAGNAIVVECIIAKDRRRICIQVSICAWQLLTVFSPSRPPAEQQLYLPKASPILCHLTHSSSSSTSSNASDTSSLSQSVLSSSLSSTASTSTILSSLATSSSSVVAEDIHAVNGLMRALATS